MALQAIAKARRIADSEQMFGSCASFAFPTELLRKGELDGMRLTNPTYHFATQFAEVGG